MDLPEAHPMGYRHGGQPHGVTWLELYIAYDVLGYNRKSMQEGEIAPLRNATHSGDKLTTRWKTWMQAKGRTLRKMPNTGIPDRPLKHQLAEFKRIVRFIVAEGGNECTDPSGIRA